MLPIAGYLISVTLALITAGAVFAVWVANRKRIAAETVGRAEEQALRIVKDAERDAETRRKEALLDAKEKAHEILTDAERQARQERQQSQTLEQSLIRREAQLTERQLSFERVEKELIVLVTPYLVNPMLCEQLPPSPGDEVTTPSDYEFYFLNRIEGRTGADWRSTTQYEKHLPAVRALLRLDAAHVIGPHGFCD